MCCFLEATSRLICREQFCHFAVLISCLRREAVFRKGKINGLFFFSGGAFMSSSSSSRRVHAAVVLRSHRLGLTSDGGRRGPLGELSDEGRRSAEAARNRRISMKAAAGACETGASEDVRPRLLFRDTQLFTSENSSFHSNILENMLFLYYCRV